MKLKTNLGWLRSSQCEAETYTSPKSTIETLEKGVNYL